MYSSINFLVLRELLHCWWLFSWWTFKQSGKTKGAILRDKIQMIIDRIDVALPLTEGPGLRPAVELGTDDVELLPWTLAFKEDG